MSLERAARQRTEAAAAALREEGERRARSFQGAVKAAAARAQAAAEAQVRSIQGRCRSSGFTSVLVCSTARRLCTVAQQEAGLRNNIACARQERSAVGWHRL